MTTDITPLFDGTYGMPLYEDGLQGTSARAQSRDAVQQKRQPDSLTKWDVRTGMTLERRKEMRLAGEVFLAALAARARAYIESRGLEAPKEKS